MRARLVLYGTLALSLVASLGAGDAFAGSDPRPEERGFPLIQTYQPGPIQAGNQNFDVAADPRGVLYVANIVGLLIYDGAWWRSVAIGKAESAFCVATDGQGGVAVGGDDDLGVLAADERGAFRFVSLLDRLPQSHRRLGQILRVHAVAEGFLFLTHDALYLWDGREMVTLASFPAERPFAISFEVGKEIYLWARGGISRLEGRRLVAVPGGDAYAGRRVDQLLPDDGGLLVSVRGEGLFRLREGRSEPFAPTASRWAREGRVQDGRRLADGRWVFSSFLGGLLFLRPDGEVDQIIDTAVGLPDNAAYSLAVDREGALWAALNNGLARVQVSSPLSQLDRRMGIEGSVYSVARHRGYLWVGTAAGLFTNAPPVTTRAAARPAGRPSLLAGRAPLRRIPGIQTSVWSLASVGDDLFVANAFGVYQLHGDEAPRLFAESDQKTAFELLRSRRDPNRIWIGLQDTLVSLYRGSGGWGWEVGSEADFPAEVRHLQESADGRLWVGVNGDGLYGLEVPPDWPRRRPAPRSIPGAASDFLFRLSGCLAVPQQAGIRCVDERRGVLVVDARFQGLDALEDIQFLAEDAEGNLWVGHDPPGVATRQGSGWSKTLTSFIDIKARAVETIVAEPAEEGGVVWVATESGLIRYAGSIRSGTPALPAPLFSRVTTDRERLLFAGLRGEPPVELELPKGARSLRFELGPLSFRSGLRYQTRLEPGEDAWSVAATEPLLHLSRLSPGAYTLHVRTVDPSAGPGPEAALRFLVPAPWYLALWALLLWTGSGVLLLVGYVRLRHRALRLRAERLEARVAAQTVELRRTVDELRRAQSDLEGANARLEELSLRDELTGIANRRRLQQVLEAEWSRARRNQLPIAFCLLDLDHFKLLNDTRGHLEGDHCLRAVAAHLSQSLPRAGDLVARYGGEEFAILLPDTDLAGALQRAEQLRQGIETLALPHEAVAGGRVTASVGVAALIPGEGQRLEVLLEAADLALYRAKSAGRNRAFAGEAPPPGRGASTEVH